MSHSRGARKRSIRRGATLVRPIAPQPGPERPASAIGMDALTPEAREAYARVVGELARVRDAVVATGGDPREVLDLPGVSRALSEGGPQLREVLARTILGIDQQEAARAQALGLDYKDLIPSGSAASRSYAVPGSEESFRPDYAAAGGYSPFSAGGGGGRSGYTRPTGAAGTQQQATGGTASGTWMGSGNRDQPVGVPNAQTLRMWADQVPPVRAAIKARRDRLGAADITVTPASERKKLSAQQKAIQQQLTQLLDQPNPERQNWGEFMGAWVEDILVLDRGCLEKGMGVKRTPSALWVQDGAAIKIYPGWDGSDPRAPRYLYEEPGTGRKQPLLNDELIVAMANASTYRYGLSPVQVLRDTIMAALDAMRSGSDFVRHKPPPTLVQFPKANQTALDNLRVRYEMESAGRRELWMVGGDEQVKVQALVASLRDNQWLEWQQWLLRLICMVMQISPQVLGITFDINRATAEEQTSITEDTGLVPLYLLCEAYLNRELLGDFAPRFPDGRTNLDALNLRVMFPEVSEEARMLHAERTIGMAATGLTANFPSMTLNMVLAAMGEEPVAGGDIFWFATAQGPMPWLGYNDETGAFGGVGDIGPEEGAQDAAGGPATDERDPESSSDQQPPKGAGTPGNGGGASSANTSGNAQTQGDEGTPSFNEASGSGGGASKRYQPRYRRGRVGDVRRPGRSWSPFLIRAALPALPPHVDLARIPQHLLGPAGALVGVGAIAGAGAGAGATLPAPQAPWHTLGRLNALDAAKAAGDVEVWRRPGARRAPAEREQSMQATVKPIGRVPQHIADAHHRPHAEVKARQDVRHEVKASFEAAVTRGRVAGHQHASEFTPAGEQTYGG